MLMKQIYI